MTDVETEKKPWDFLLKKPTQWLRAFDLLRHRHRHYDLTFNTPDGRAVLVDLAKFCRANATTIGPTDPQTYALIGRREVWLRIMEHLNLSPEQLTELYYGPTEGTGQ